MNGRRGLVLVGLVVLMAPQTALAQPLSGICAAAPPIVGPVTLDSIFKAATEGLRIVGDEARQSGPAQALTRKDRTRRFRELSSMNWRWVCDNRSRLDRPAYAGGLVRGLLYLDLADDRPNARTWLPLARSSVQTLTPMLTYGKMRLDEIVNRATSHLAPAQAKVQEYYSFSIGKSG
jgi:hypothetical protein